MHNVQGIKKTLPLPPLGARSKKKRKIPVRRRICNILWCLILLIFPDAKNPILDKWGRKKIRIWISKLSTFFHVVLNNGTNVWKYLDSYFFFTTKFISLPHKNLFHDPTHTKKNFFFLFFPLILLLLYILFKTYPPYFLYSQTVIHVYHLNIIFLLRVAFGVGVGIY